MEGVLLLSPGLMEFVTSSLLVRTPFVSHFLWLRTRTIFLFYEPVCACVCVCVFNSMCVLERATHRLTPTERWCVVYDVAARVGASSRFRASGQDRRTAAMPASDQPGPSKAPPPLARASHPIRSAPLQRIGAAFMPGQSGRDLSLAQE